MTYSSSTGAACFTFTNVPGGHFSVYGATNLLAPSWIYLGSPTENPNGGYSIYSFTDSHTSTNKQRFYKVTSPKADLSKSH
ncbi:MAG TPA: hypothetical protein VFB72_13440 [Verrucomicrobiae bacterium]|nr:hypothetical protein [Verrucomicrobiae bacterium]